MSSYVLYLTSFLSIFVALCCQFLKKKKLYYNLLSHAVINIIIIISGSDVIAAVDDLSDTPCDQFVINVSE